jgi:hypothetical protein
MARKKRQEQPSLPGTDGDRHKDLDELIKEVAEMTEQWQGLGQEMTAGREKLLELMDKKGLTSYHCIDTVPAVTVTVKETKRKIALAKDKLAKGDADAEMELGE